MRNSYSFSPILGNLAHMLYVDETVGQILEISLLKFLAIFLNFT